ncbi:DUF4752 family protein [Leclercia adecarboxylata]|uniref:DUF4752 family protein n=1 Tax=Leclercia adecarboxylata TaxID=83655 RepID=UPI000E3DAE15|nr:DUF4752 family protein [Leclercia adecarboxylata]RFS80615.1 DUF4752 family protein [Leclercia adecarboxylata]
MSWLETLNSGLALMGYLFIIHKSFQWVVSVAFKSWDKRRKDTRQQKAVNELYDAFELADIQPGTTVRIATKGNLTIMMYRTEGAAQ